MRYSLIKSNDVVNGVGVSVSLWTQGCPHHCNGCFNKETWDFKQGIEFTANDIFNILDMLDRDGIHRNLSILGGEPLCPENIEGVIELCNVVKQHRPNTKIFIWSGYTLEEIMTMYDYSRFNFDVLIDGKFKEELKDLSLTLKGSKNQRVIDLQRSLKSNEIILYI